MYRQSACKLNYYHSCHDPGCDVIKHRSVGHGKHSRQKGTAHASLSPAMPWDRCPGSLTSKVLLPSIDRSASWEGGICIWMGHDDACRYDMQGGSTWTVVAARSAWVTRIL